MIEIELLEKYDAVLKQQKVRNYFRKRPSSHTVSNYFGTVKMNNFNDEGREFIQLFMRITFW
jgi:hypothetical protein